MLRPTSRVVSALAPLRWLRIAVSARYAGFASFRSLRWFRIFPLATLVSHLSARYAGFASLILRTFVRPPRGRNMRYLLPRDSLALIPRGTGVPFKASFDSSRVVALRRLRPAGYAALATLRWLRCAGFAALASLRWLRCAGYATLATLRWLRCAGCAPLAPLRWLRCAGLGRSV